MRIGIVHTYASPCECHVTIKRSLSSHDVVLIDADEILLRTREASQLDWVFDQTDTFRGEGLLRPIVRQVLETHGARVVGSSACAMWLADDKVAAKRALADAGVPVPPGQTVTTVAEALAADLPFPRVVKASFEHMSRGVTIAKDARSLAAAVADVLEESRAACLIEAFVGTRELGVTVLGDTVLPVAEWPIERDAVLTYDAKRHGPDPVVAALPAPLRERLEEAALRAFRALSLSDWARFDVRLDQAGAFHFLEANVSPSVETGSPTLVSAAAAGLTETALLEAVLSAASERWGGERAMGAKHAAGPVT